MKESLKFGESLIMDGMKLRTSNHHTSGKLIGEVTIDEYDKTGKKIFSEKTVNDITLPGSIFVLEQIFKKISKSGHRFLHPTNVPTGSYSDTKEGTINNDKIDTDDGIYDEYIFGFMIGHGGESSSSIISPKYESSKLSDSNNVSSFLPFRIIDNNELDPIDDGINYYLKATANDKDGKTMKYFYAKGFTKEPSIYSKWSDGSGNVQEGDLDYDVPILTYGEIILDIDEKDVREYFLPSESEQCYINQLGLVAGKPNWISDSKGNYVKDTNDNYIIASEENTSTDRYRLEFSDVKLVTTLNFKSKDLSNDENKIKFTYKIYCL